MLLPETEREYEFNIRNKYPDFPCALVCNNCFNHQRCTLIYKMSDKLIEVGCHFDTTVIHTEFFLYNKSNFLDAMGCYGNNRKTAYVELYDYSLETETMSKEPLLVWHIKDSNKEGNFFNKDSWEPHRILNFGYETEKPKKAGFEYIFWIPKVK